MSNTLIRRWSPIVILLTLLPLTSATECIVSDWSEWSECFGDCLFGQEVRNRDVQRPPLPEEMDNGSPLIRLCPHLYETKNCIPIDCNRETTHRDVHSTHSNGALSNSPLTEDSDLTSPRTREEHSRHPNRKEHHEKKHSWKAKLFDSSNGSPPSQPPLDDDFIMNSRKQRLAHSLIEQKNQHETVRNQSASSLKNDISTISSNSTESQMGSLLTAFERFFEKSNLTTSSSVTSDALLTSTPKYFVNRLTIDLPPAVIEQMANSSEGVGSVDKVEPDVALNEIFGSSTQRPLLHRPRKEHATSEKTPKNRTPHAKIHKTYTMPEHDEMWKALTTNSKLMQKLIAAYEKVTSALPASTSTTNPTTTTTVASGSSTSSSTTSGSSSTTTSEPSTSSTTAFTSTTTSAATSTQPSTIMGVKTQTNKISVDQILSSTVTMPAAWSTSTEVKEVPTSTERSSASSTTTVPSAKTTVNRSIDTQTTLSFVPANSTETTTSAVTSATAKSASKPNHKKKLAKSASHKETKSVVLESVLLPEMSLQTVVSSKSPSSTTSSLPVAHLHPLPSEANIVDVEYTDINAMVPPRDVILDRFANEISSQPEIVLAEGEVGEQDSDEDAPWELPSSKFSKEVDEQERVPKTSTTTVSTTTTSHSTTTTGAHTTIMDITKDVSSNNDTMWHPHKGFVPNTRKHASDITSKLYMTHEIVQALTKDQLPQPSENECGLNMRCCKVERTICSDGSKPTLIKKYYRPPGSSVCMPYHYPRCSLIEEMDEQPIQYLQNCEDICFKSPEKRISPLFTVDNGVMRLRI